ncbi:MAG: DUF924 family protein [Proteobacteria bacterium]|nr:DUF924 family protein [Pseudomonadota bacterium]
MTLHAHDVVEFWRAAGPRRWFARDAAFDADCRTRFLDAHHAAARREFEAWMGDPDGALALLILLDQIPRNIFRGSAHSYATDGLAREYARRAIEAGFDAATAPELRAFFYLPFEHSEDIADQERSLDLHRALPGDDPAHWARLHHDIIRRFGRFPHRNAALGRASTPEEQAFLEGGGFAG